MEFVPMLKANKWKMAFQGHYITKELLKDEEENVEAIDARIRNESRWFKSFSFLMQALSLPAF